MERWKLYALPVAVALLGFVLIMSSCLLPANGSSRIVSEQVVESHSVSSVTKVDEGGTAVYHVIEQADGADVANTYTSDMKCFEVRDDDGLGQRVDKVRVERTDWIGTRNSEEYRLYVQ